MLKPECLIENCDRESYSVGLCASHYARKRLGRDMLKPLKHRLPRECTVWACVGEPVAKSLCQVHYNQLRKFGHAGPPISDPRWIPYSQWYLVSTGYVIRQKYQDSAPGPVTVFQHRWVMEQELGRKLTAEETVHHKNGDRSDNRLSNLELWSKSQPAGQRVEDKVAWALEILALYQPKALA